MTLIPISFTCQRFIQIQERIADEGPSGVLYRIEIPGNRGFTHSQQSVRRIRLLPEMFDVAVERPGQYVRFSFGGRAAEYMLKPSPEALDTIGLRLEDPLSKRSGSLDVRDVIECQKCVEWNVRPRRRYGTRLPTGHVEEHCRSNNPAPEHIDAASIERAAGVAIVTDVSKCCLLPDAIRLIRPNRRPTHRMIKESGDCKSHIPYHP
jgi:hypothetical protein